MYRVSPFGSAVARLFHPRAPTDHRPPLPAPACAQRTEAIHRAGGHGERSPAAFERAENLRQNRDLIETPEEINAEDLRGAERVGVTAGASTPNWLIEQVVARLREIGETRGAAEPVGAR